MSYKEIKTVYPIIEIYTGFEGEGLFVGTPQVFVRFSGCNLDCPFCDTKYAWDGSVKPILYDDEGLCQELSKYSNYKKISLTGGEPLLFVQYMDRLFSNLMGIFDEINIETNGSLYHKNLEILRGNLFLSISPKMDYLSEVNGYIDNLKKLLNVTMKYQIKFLIDDTKFDKDMNKLKIFMELFDVPKEKIIIQPVWYEDRDYSKIVESIMSKVVDFRVIPQVHKFIYGNKRGV